MQRITEPTSTVRQLSGANTEGQFILSVLAKRTYSINKGRCWLAAGQIPIQEDIETDASMPDLVTQDTDLYPIKPFTDVVVKGSARAGVARRYFDVSVALNRWSKSIRVFGTRRAMLSPGGRIVLSEPEPVAEVPLRYDYAYGGRDRFAESKYGNPAEKFAEYLPENLPPELLTPYRYPRNPCGRGYLMEASRDAVDNLVLPMLEDPEDPLSPSRLVVGSPGRWTGMPVPHCFDWVNMGWFPRVAYLGILPQFDPPGGPVAEVARGWAPADILEDKILQEKFSLRLANGASLGLQLPHLTGEEICQLESIHPRASLFTFSLPSDRPRIATDGRNGKLNATEPVIHTVLVEPNEDRISVVWRGSAVALRPYMPEELATMPLLVEWQ